MAFEFKLPDIGEGVVEGEIVKWKVAEGETIKLDQPMVEVMTDKATVEIPAPRGGKVTRIMVAEGKICAVGQVMIVIDDGVAAVVKEAPAAPAPHLNGNAGAGNGKAAPAVHMSTQMASNVPESLPAIPARPAVAPVVTPSGSRVLATPATRKIARELGVDLQQVPATGKHGRVTTDDVKGFRAPSSSAAAPAASLPVAARDAISIPRTALEERVPFRGVRKAIAANMTRSKFTATHFTYVEEVDMTDLVALRGRAKEKAAERGVKLTYLPFIVKAAVAALKKWPSLNASLDEASQEIVYKKYYHLGVATQGPQGLAVSVIRDADKRSIFDLAKEIERLSVALRDGKATREDLTGSTFTISSLGQLGGVLATPIINFPESGIMGVHKIAEKPAVRNGQIVIRQLMNLSISVDHRIADGYDGAMLLQEVKTLLEDPTLMFLEMIQVEPLAPAASSHFERPVASAASYFAGDDLAKAKGLLQILRPDGTTTGAFAAPERLLALRMYKHMRFIRIMDERLLALQRQGRIGFYGEARGQEAAITGSAAALEKGDWIVPALREAGVGLYVGMTLRSYIAQLFGNANDVTKGRQLPCHPCGKEVNYVVMSSCVSSQVPHAVGIAMAMKISGDKGKVAVGYMGDGGVSEPDVHVALNFAGVYKAPVVLFCQNNQWAISTPGKVQTASETIAIKALAYGVEPLRVDGNDVLAVHAAMRYACDKARRGDGPTFIEALTYRVSAHSSSDDPSRYRDENVTLDWRQKKDPLERMRLWLRAQGWLIESDDARLAEDIEKEVRDATALEEAAPLPGIESMIEDVFETPTLQLREQMASYLLDMQTQKGH